MFSKEEIETQFNAIYERLYGHHSPDDIIEVVNYRVTVLVPVHKALTAQRTSEKGVEVIEKLYGYFNGEKHEMSVYDRECLVTGTKIAGPAIVVELTSTTVVPPGWKLTVDEADSMIMTKE